MIVIVPVMTFFVVIVACMSGVVLCHLLRIDAESLRDEIGKIFLWILEELLIAALAAVIESLSSSSR